MIVLYTLQQSLRERNEKERGKRKREEEEKRKREVREKERERKEEMARLGEGGGKQGRLQNFLNR